ncbi:transposase [Bacillus massilinigeriensis]|uniref:transposase n=1 Tax=Bacillus mediterraneensis TaxID=1805474 RepID=UPI003D15F69D
MVATLKNKHVSTRRISRTPKNGNIIKKYASGYEQSYKVYDYEDCGGCPFKTTCTKAKGNCQFHWNPVFEEMKAKAKTALECKEQHAIYPRRIVKGESVAIDRSPGFNCWVSIKFKRVWSSGNGPQSTESSRHPPGYFP